MLEICLKRSLLAALCTNPPGFKLGMGPSIYYVSIISDFSDSPNHYCDNYVPQWWVELDDGLSWLFTTSADSVLSDKWKLRECE